MSVSKTSRHILVGITGSIAAYKVCTVISKLVQQGHSVQVIATPSALKFVGTATLEGLTGRKVHTDIWQEGQMMSHIDLGRWADVFLIAPLTAAHLNKMALGLSDDLLTTTYLAFEKTKPILLAPAMNTEMLTHVTTQESLKKLTERGHSILETQAGTLACGETGPGKMAEPETILSAIQQLLEKPKQLPRILITYGGTQEPIDGVRVLTNISSGRTGATLADAFAQLHFQVDTLRASTAPAAALSQSDATFTSAADLENKMYSLLSAQNYDYVVHLAAVSDYYVEKIQSDSTALTPNTNLKLNSETDEVVLTLKKNKKIVNQLKTYSKNPNIQVIAFKLTNTPNKLERLDATLKLLNSTGVDAVVHNDVSEIKQDRSHHPFQIYSRNDWTGQASDAKQLATTLRTYFSQLGAT